MARWVEEDLAAIGLPVERDETGNLLTAVGVAPRTILLCAHLDTVPPHGPIEPVVVDGAWTNARDDILGADNKAAVAVLLQAAERWVREPPPVAVELLFTVREETALAGAKAFDASRLDAEWGYVYDHASPIGEVVCASPTYLKLTATFHGKAAHAGIRPQEGRSAVAAAARAIAAMELGRLDERTTANVGRIEGGPPGATNVVPDRCELLAEARSLDADRAREVMAAMVDRVHEAANAAACQCDADTTVEELFGGYEHPPTQASVLAAEDALRACGHTPRRIVTGGGSDANAFERAGLPCTNLANGTTANHEPTEAVAVEALEAMLDVTFALAEACARR